MLSLFRKDFPRTLVSYSASCFHAFWGRLLSFHPPRAPTTPLRQHRAHSLFTSASCTPHITHVQREAYRCFQGRPKQQAICNMHVLLLVLLRQCAREISIVITQPCLPSYCKPQRQKGVVKTTYLSCLHALHESLQICNCFKRCTLTGYQRM